MPPATAQQRVDLLPCKSNKARPASSFAASTNSPAMNTDPATLKNLPLFQPCFPERPSA
jgi:hypothetical protein